jgi:hypothetical protein
MQEIHVIQQPKRGVAAWLLLSIALTAVSVEAARAQEPVRRVELKVLVLSDGQFATNAFSALLKEALVPYDERDLNTTTVDESFLVEVDGATRRARYQAVVLPSAAPPQLSMEERSALNTFKSEFKIREFNAYVSPATELGFRPVSEGTLDGLTAKVTDEGKRDAFAYLDGLVEFANVDSTSESFGYLVMPRDELGPQQKFTKLVTMRLPSDTVDGVVLGVFSEEGRERMVLTAGMNENQFQYQALFPGILNWLTRGVHLGTERNYFSVHIDDVFMSNKRWNSAMNCTGGIARDEKTTAICPEVGPEILMTPQDVDALVEWQATNGMKLDLVFNGKAYEDAEKIVAGDAEALSDEAVDPVAAGRAYRMGQRLLELRQSFRWISHTYSHDNLDEADVVKLNLEIVENAKFAERLLLDGAMNLSFDPGELVTGQHSGLKGSLKLPANDNPNLADALTANGILWIGSDNSRDSEYRQIGTAHTVPRYPMNIFYNVGTKAEQLDEYNAMYTLEAEGGICKPSRTTTCSGPVERGFDGIVSNEKRIALEHVLENNPAPHYVHQSNLAEDQVLYDVLDAVLTQYRETFRDDDSALVNATMTEFGTELQQRANWKKALDDNRIEAAYVEAGELNVKIRAGAEIDVPLTVPVETGGLPATITPYTGARSGWHPSGMEIKIKLPTEAAEER